MCQYSTYKHKRCETATIGLTTDLKKVVAQLISKDSVHNMRGIFWSTTVNLCG